MSTTTKHLMTAVATAAFALVATATTVTNAFAQSTAAPVANGVASTAAKTAVANGALAASKSEQPSGLTRAQVRAEYLEARKNGTIPETEADFDVAQTKKQFAK